MARLLENKIAIVTGAGHGIGRGHALELARHGAKVVVNDLGTTVAGEGSGKDADEVVALIERRGGVAVADYGDVADDEQGPALIDRAVSEFGRLDILVNNAGIGRDKVIWNMSADDFDIVMKVHVRGTWLTTREAALRWRARSKAAEKFTGRIINTTSGAGLSGNFGQSNYATAKAAIVGFTHLLAGFDNPTLVQLVGSLLDQSYTSRQATYDLRRLKRKGLIVRLSGHHRYQLTPLGRRVAVLFTKTHSRILAPGLALLDPVLPPDLAQRSPLAAAWRHLDQALNQFVDTQLFAA